jgi:hypothetical protein
MLIPQFTLRRLLALTAVCGGVFLVLSQAVAGSAWAIGVSVAIGSLVAVFAAYAAVFGGVWILTLLPLGRDRRRQAGSPFAAADRPATSPFTVEGS